MKVSQLPLFIRQRFEKAPQRQTLEPVTPTAESNVRQTLLAYRDHLRSRGYSESTTVKYFADVNRFSHFIGEKKMGKITTHDVEQWIAGLLSKNGEKLNPKSVNRKVSAIINYFLWLSGLGIISKDPTATLTNSRIQSPLPDYLYEDEIQTMYKGASTDIRTYLLVFLFLEAGIKSSELFGITKAHIDISDAYRPEIW